jgi:hypothetical protein
VLQKFKEEADSTLYKITLINFPDYGAAASQANLVEMQFYKNLNRQKWVLIVNNDGTVSLRNVFNNLVAAYTSL